MSWPMNISTSRGLAVGPRNLAQAPVGSSHESCFVGWDEACWEPLVVLGVVEEGEGGGVGGGVGGVLEGGPIGLDDDIMVSLFELKYFISVLI